MKTNFANRYVAKYVSTYSITSLFFTSRCVKKERKQQLQAHPHSRMVGGQLGFFRSFLIKLDNSQPLSFTNITLD